MQSLGNKLFAGACSPNIKTVLSEFATLSIRNFNSRAFLLSTIIILFISFSAVKILNQIVLIFDNFMTVSLKML